MFNKHFSQDSIMPLAVSLSSTLLFGLGFAVTFGGGEEAGYYLMLPVIFLELPVLLLLHFLPISDAGRLVALLVLGSLYWFGLAFLVRGIYRRVRKMYFRQKDKLAGDDG